MLTHLVTVAGLLLAFTAPTLFGQAPSNTSEDCACESPVPAVLATVGSTSILSKDLSAQTVASIQNQRQEVIDARKRELDLQINSKLLELEAKKLGLTTKQLLDREVVAKVRPTVAEAREFYDKNAARLDGRSFESVQKDILDYLRQEKQQQVAKEFAERLRTMYPVRKLVETAAPPASPADRQKVLATVNGQPIRSLDIEDSLRALIYSMQKSAYRFRKEEVDLRINDVLLEAEAKKQATTSAALLRRDVTDKLTPVTDLDAQKFFDQNKERINGEFAAVKPQIIQYLTTEKSNKALAAYSEKLRSTTTIKYFIAAPEPPMFAIPVTDQPARGVATAQVTVVEFIDFQCRRCAALHPDLLKLVDEFKGKARLVILDFPLDQHQHARKAAEAAEAALAQGKYWEYVDVLLKNQLSLDIPKLKEYARTVGLDGGRFDADLDSGKYAHRVDEDANTGTRVGVGATPSIFVNGRQVEDLTLAGIRAAITTALGSR